MAMVTLTVCIVELFIRIWRLVLRFYTPGTRDSIVTRVPSPSPYRTVRRRYQTKGNDRMTSAEGRRHRNRSSPMRKTQTV
jgi:hypothetical protein